MDFSFLALVGSDEVNLARLLFLILLPVVALAPPRIAIIAWLLMGNLDPSGPNSDVTGSIGWMNAVKGVALPMFLLWRIRSIDLPFLNTVPMKLWLGLIGYAAISSLWSPFPLPALKLVGNMVGILLTFAVLRAVAIRGLIGAVGLAALIVGSLAMGVLQTYLVGDGLYGFDGVGQPARFTSFVSAQQFAAFLVAFLAIALWHPQFRPWMRVALSLSVITSLAFNGSRTWFVGALLVVLIFIWLSSPQVLAFAMLGLATLLLSGLLYINLDPNLNAVFANTPSRIVATGKALLTGVDTSRQLGLANLNFRLAIYDRTFQDLGAATTTEWLFGHGTSSGGNILLRTFPRSYTQITIDSNRSMHNEWLRTLYEWGLSGSILLLASLGAMVVGLCRRYRSPGFRLMVAPALSALPAFLLAFSTENLLAGAGNAITMSLALLVALCWAPSSTYYYPRRYEVNTAH